MLEIYVAAAPSGAPDGINTGTEVFWGAVAAIGTIAALIASLVTIGIGAWLRNRNRPEPEWEVEIRYESETRLWVGKQIGATFSGSITNVGDGSAFQLRLKRKGGSEIRMWWEDAKFQSIRASMRTGDKVNFSFVVGLDDWEGEIVTLTWVEPPTRLGKTKCKSVDLTQGKQQPEISFTREGYSHGMPIGISRAEWEIDNASALAAREQARMKRAGL